MLAYIDNFLNKITMYRLVLYSLCVFFFAALILSLFKILPYNPLLMLAGSLLIITVCVVTNKILANLFGAETNVESVYISAFILILIVSPLERWSDIRYWGFLFLVSVLAMASKFILALHKKHVFNPAALAVALAAFTIGTGASWWIGNVYLLPLVLIGGILITRKIRRADLVITFMTVAFVTLFITGHGSINNFGNFMSGNVLYSPLFFFGFIMLTEPLTTPPQKWQRWVYGALVGVLSSPFLHIGYLYASPEIALLVGNIFSYIVSPKQKLILSLKEKVQIAKDTYDFVFVPDKDFTFFPGQYLEWTINPENSDTRGNRRYFTIASSPTEKEIRIGVKFYPNGSTFKRKLFAMNVGDKIVASQLAGEFVLPQTKTKKVAMLAGGIGVTPFRSMLQYLVDKGERRDLVMLYSNKTTEDIAYKDIISEAENKIGLKNTYVVTDQSGVVNEELIQKEIPDYRDRYFYLSGPHGMVIAYEQILKNLGVEKRKIKKDFFPGYA